MRLKEDKALLEAIKSGLGSLSALLERVNDEWVYEDGIYRFYHHSFKVYRLQQMTEEIVAALESLLPGHDLAPSFIAIVKDGTGKEFDLSHNEDWLRHTRPIVEAFFHARYFLEMVLRYGQELDTPPQILPSGWAAVLSLYRIR